MHRWSSVYGVLCLVMYSVKHKCGTFLLLCTQAGSSTSGLISIFIIILLFVFIPGKV